MKMPEILKEIEILSHGQGFYGRLYRWLTNLKAEDPDGYSEVTTELENQNFRDTIDMVLYFET